MKMIAQQQQQQPIPHNRSKPPSKIRQSQPRARQHLASHPHPAPRT
uniref:Uncharacterized protein n=1 Tax=Arundo donax TaxID=35708 RepID=A0A0A8ZE78_ARUDO